MALATFAYQIGSIGYNFQSQGSITANAEIVTNPVSIGPAKAGTLTTRTNATSGVITMSGGHGITSGTGDLYWGVGKRIGVTLSVATNAITISGGTGTDLPAQDSAINVINPVNSPFAIADTSTAVLLAGSCNAAQSTATVFDAADALVLQMNMTGSNGSYIWDDNTGATNPLLTQSDTQYALLSHGDTTTAYQVTIIALVD